jgi:hypothetical protein
LCWPFTGGSTLGAGRYANKRRARMISIESVLPIFEAIDGADLSPRTFSAVCATSGWSEPVNDGIGLWEVTNPANGAMLIFDTVTKPTTLFCRLDAHDDYEPDALQEAALRRTFDERFVHSLEQLRRRFPQSLALGTYASPYNWRFAHFRGLNSLIALEQTYYDPIMGVQLMLLLQPLPSEPRRSAITAGW